MTDEPPVPAAAPPPPPAGPRPLPRGVNCVRCLYELMGLDASGACPECSTPIAESLKSDDLIFAPPAALSWLRIGALLATWGGLAWVVASVIGWPVLMVLTGGLRGPLAAVPALALHASAAMVMSRGVWILTGADGRRGPGRTERWQAVGARWLIIGSLAAAETALCLMAVSGVPMEIVLLSSFVGGTLGWGLVLLVVARLYRRCRAGGLAGWATAASVMLLVCVGLVGAIAAAAALAAVMPPAMAMVAAVSVGLVPAVGLVLLVSGLTVALIVMAQLGPWLGNARDRAEAIEAAGGLREFIDAGGTHGPAATPPDHERGSRPNEPRP